MLIGFSLLGLCACDDGRIYPDTSSSAEGKTVVLEGVLEGFDSWSSNYRVSIAGFEQADDEYASVSKVITASDIQEDGKALVELSGIKDNPAELLQYHLCQLSRCFQQGCCRTLPDRRQELSGPGGCRFEEGGRQETGRDQ